MRLFTMDDTFIQALQNTLLLTAGCLLTQTPLAVFFGYMLRKGFSGQGFFKTVFFIPNMISSVAAALMWSFILHPEFGVINNLLRLAGMESLTRTWLGDPGTALMWVVIAIAWQFFGYHMIIYLTAMQNISGEIIEAASIDGATGFQNFWKITLPLIVPIMKVDFVLIVTGSLRTFDIIYAMTSGGPNHATEVIASHLYFRSFQGMQFGYGSSMAVILIILCLAATWIINRAFRNAESNVV
jgi:raffinose/stachyose/melibiose transport system permease protein